MVFRLQFSRSSMEVLCLGASVNHPDIMHSSIMTDHTPNVEGPELRSEIAQRVRRRRAEWRAAESREMAIAMVSTFGLAVFIVTGIALLAGWSR